MDNQDRLTKELRKTAEWEWGKVGEGEGSADFYGCRILRAIVISGDRGVTSSEDQWQLARAKFSKI